MYMENTKQVIGEGTYGCVIRESLKCEDQKSPSFYENKVSKIMTAKSARDELNEMKTIAKTKGIDKYALSVPTLCKPKIGSEFMKVAKNCNNKHIKLAVRDRLYAQSNISLLILENGGNDLNTIQRKMYENFTLDDKKKFFTGLLNLFDGLQFFIDNDIIHYDIKAGNIVYNIHTGTAKFIDFGLANKISVVIEKCKKDNNWLAVSHGYYPIESSCMNKSKFLFSNKTHCKKLREAFQNNYDDFIKTATHSFDMYSLCYALDRIFEDLKDFERALRGKTEVYNFLDAGLFQIRSNRAMPLQFRNANPTELKEKLKDLLKVYNLYDVDKPVPSVELKELSNKHSYPLNVDRKCPSSKPDYNPKTKKCVAKCKDNKVRNENFRCVTKKKSSKLKPQNEIPQDMNSSNLKPQNEIPQSMNSTRRRSASYNPMPNNRNNTTKKCRPDQILNPNTNRCVKRCKPNQMRNKDFRCVSKKNKKAALDMSLL